MKDDKEMLNFVAFEISVIDPEYGNYTVPFDLEEGIISECIDLNNTKSIEELKDALYIVFMRLIGQGEDGIIPPETAVM